MKTIKKASRLYDITCSLYTRIVSLVEELVTGRLSLIAETLLQESLMLEADTLRLVGSPWPPSQPLPEAEDS